jgi:uncharacterized protein YjlB
MFALETVKRTVERMTGLARPSRRDLQALLRPRKPNIFHFKDDGLTPNNPTLPMVIYRSAVKLPDSFDPAAVFEELFASNGWQDSWRNGIYDFSHYHSRIHEVLGIARGQARVLFGGSKGRRINLKAGDVVVMPAGTGHKRLSATDDLLVVGAYPRAGKYDECRPRREDHDRAISSIPHVPLPHKDPAYGRDGPLVHQW